MRLFRVLFFEMVQFITYKDYEVDEVTETSRAWLPYSFLGQEGLELISGTISRKLARGQPPRELPDLVVFGKRGKV